MQEWADYLQTTTVKCSIEAKAGRKERRYGENLSWASVNIWNHFM